MKFILIFILIIFSNSFCELIDGPANIRNSPKGELLFSLYDSIEVSCTELKNSWYEIGISIRLTKDQYKINTLILKKGSKLYDQDGIAVGEALKDLLISSKSSWGPINSKFYGTDLTGFTYKNNIKLKSIVENSIEKIINTNSNDIQFTEFIEHIKKYKYEEIRSISGFTDVKSYNIHENWVDDPSPLDRVRLMFQDNILIAIVHSRKLKIESIYSVTLESNRYLSIFKHFSKEDLDYFIEMNNKFYWGVD